MDPRTVSTKAAMLIALGGLLMSCAKSHSGADAAGMMSTADRLSALAVAGHRSPDNVARNPYRHPVETLSFFGIEENMTVIEALPGGSLWYAEILAPLLREQGQYIAADYDVDLPDQPAYRLRGRKKMLLRFEEEAAIFGNPRIAKLTAPQSIDLGPDGSADAVLTFRSTHGWIRDEAADAVYRAFFDVLKPGGVLGVVQHRAGPKTNTSEGAFTGYVAQDRLIAIAEAAGFELEASSEINANPKDTADYEKGVWTLPPVLTNGDENRARYRAIGESDRMTLRFRKPS